MKAAGEHMTIVEMQPIARGVKADQLADEITRALKQLGPLKGEEAVRALVERIRVSEDDVVFALGRVALTFDADGRVSVQ